VPEAPGYSGFKARTYPREVNPVEITVPTVTLDEFLPREFVPRLLKIDVEGAELQVLRGGRRILERDRPIVLFEHGLGAADRYGTGPRDVFGFLQTVGYRIFDLDGGGPYSERDFEQTFRLGHVWNFVALV
jgi:hypothetical protein